MRAMMAKVVCAAALLCSAGCATYEVTDRRYSNPFLYPYPYMHTSWVAPSYYSPLHDWRKSEIEKYEEKFEAEPK